MKAVQHYLDAAACFKPIILNECRGGSNVGGGGGVDVRNTTWEPRRPPHNVRAFCMYVNFYG